MIFEQATGTYLDHELRSADSTVLFTTGRRNQAVNDGIREFCELTECLLRISTVTCSCNTSTYNLLSSAVLGSTDFVRIAPRGVEYHVLSSHGGSSARLTQLAGDEDFPRRDIEWLNAYEPGWRQSTTPQMPTGYYVDEADGKYVVGLDHPPDIGSSEVGKLIVPFIARPALLTSSGDVPFTIGSAVRQDLIPFHQATVHYAAHQLWKLKGDAEESDRQWGKFMAYVERYAEKTRKRGANVVRLAKNYLRAASRGGGDRAQDPYSWP